MAGTRLPEAASAASQGLHWQEAGTGSQSQVPNPGTLMWWRHLNARPNTPPRENNLGSNNGCYVIKETRIRERARGNMWSHLLPLLPGLPWKTPPRVSNRRKPLTRTSCPEAALDENFQHGCSVPAMSESLLQYGCNKIIMADTPIPICTKCRKLKTY